MKYTLAVLATLLLLASATTQALGKKGHKLVCQLAYNTLSTDKQNEVDSLLGGIPEAHVKHINRFLERGSGQKISFADSCVWADAIKRQYEYKMYGPWHFINVTRDDLSVDPGDCKRNCVTRAIEVHQKQLREAKDLWKKTQALMFLGHWVGDIHQPLHVSFQSDWGGNKVKVASKTDQCTNLHWIWDSCIIGKPSDDEKQLLSEFHEKLKGINTSLWLNQDQYSWGTESLLIARTPSVNYCVSNANNVCESHDLNKPITLEDNYMSVHKPILEKRILQAGIRLAELLNKAL